MTNYEANLTQDASDKLKQGCHPRRQTELVAQRISVCDQVITELECLAAQQEQRAVNQAQQIVRRC